MKKGFTLIELIVVISIVALLAIVGISTYNNIQIEARNTKRKSDLKELKNALEAYKFQNGSYPSTIGKTRCYAPADAATNGHQCGVCNYYKPNGVINLEGANGYIPDLAPDFISKLPVDPRSGQANASSSFPWCRDHDGINNCYVYRSNGRDYKLSAICTPEGTLDSNDPYYTGVHVWSVYSSSTSKGW